MAASNYLEGDLASDFKGGCKYPLCAQIIGLNKANLDVDILGVWHLYRIPIILTTFFLLLAARTFLYIRFGRDKIIYTPPSSSPKIVAPIEKAQLVPLVEKAPEKTPIVAEVKKAAGPKRVVGKVTRKKSPQRDALINENVKFQVLVFFASLAGGTERTAKAFTAQLAETMKSTLQSTKYPFLEPAVHDLAEVDYDEFFLTLPKCADGVSVKYFYIILLPTYNIDSMTDAFIEHLQETHNDFRVDTAPLSPLLGYSVFGFGDREGWPTEEEGFCSQAGEVDRWMAKLTARKRAFPLGMGDTKTDAAERLEEWRQGVQDVLENLAQTGNLGEGVVGSGDADESDVESVDEDNDEVLFEGDALTQKKRKNKTATDMADLEDIGSIMKKGEAESEAKESSGPLAVDFTTYSKKAPKLAPVIKEMVPKGSPTYNALTKQGYTIVGSHSGVKICRWTKSALRGRGSCYKYSFYGIASHQCMETTPSLSCSNKCVFCWRHGTNPVGTTWRWVVDQPEDIFNGVKAGHYQKIKMMRGVPGVRAERFAEAMRIRHCALSLVGEPISYPYLNEFTAMLHKEHISSFLVCNAQHPDQLAALKQVTQLYVSIDASNRESLRKIDRPLHRDFWERFQRCLEILREKRFEQRTVFRLTLVKGFNIEDEAEGYADLIEKGLPCFVEVKGVTYCGTSSSAGAGLTMQNVPFYEEVCAFVLALNAALERRGLKYGIAAEHAHSCCILIASERFKKEGKWHTRIDYKRFFELLESGEKFTPEDYMGPETPEWATWGKGGFDPRDERVYRKGKNKVPLKVEEKEVEEAPALVEI